MHTNSTIHLELIQHIFKKRNVCVKVGLRTLIYHLYHFEFERHRWRKGEEKTNDSELTVTEKENRVVMLVSAAFIYVESFSHDNT